MINVSLSRTIAVCALVWGLGGITGCTVVKAGTDETRVHPLDPAGSLSAAPDAAAPPDTPIVFKSDRNGDMNLFRMDVAGGNVTALTSGASLNRPRWAPDGSAIAARYLDIMAQTSGIALLAPDGTQRTPLTSGDPPAMSGLSVNWAPDAQQLGFAAFVEATSEAVQEGAHGGNHAAYRLHTISRAGGGLHPLFPDRPGSQRDAAWSPVDPSQLAYAAAPPDTLDIWLKDMSNDAEPINLTNDRVAYPLNIQWSPDGTKLAFEAFARTGEGGLGSGNGHLAGAGPQQVPDTELYILDVASGELQRLTENAGDDAQPCWSPDGTELLYSSAPGDDFDIWVMPVADPSQAHSLIDDDDDPHWDESADWRWSSE